MSKGLQETIRVRITSTMFTVIALGVFKPFGLGEWRWEAFAHLLAICIFGFFTCFLSELILNYVIRIPRSYEHGVNYIIRRNMWFQLINIPLVALMICLYRHFMMSDRIESNLLSWNNYFETLLIIAFCSFAIGLYWRFKFRSRYLAAELEETRQLNEQLQKLQRETELHEKETGNVTEKSTTSESQSAAPAEQVSQRLVLTGSTSETVTVQIQDLLYIETVGNYVKVFHLLDGKVRNDMLRATSKQMEDELQAYPTIVRCHRAFLVNLQQVEKIVSKSGNMQLLIMHCHESIPVSRSNTTQVKEAIKGVL